MYSRQEKALAPVSPSQSEQYLGRADFVIIGNGIAGLTAAVEARRLAPQKRIVMITNQLYPTINTPALKQFAIGTFVFGLLPILYGIFDLGDDLLDYWKTRDTKVRFLGFPVVLLWNMFLIIGLQVHGIALALAWTLWHAWTPKKKAA